MTTKIITGDARTALADIPDGSIQCCVTSPGYFGLRSYLPADHPDKAFEHGAEPTLAEYVANLVAVFREVRRCLRDDGTLFLNLGDSYATGTTAPRKATTITGPDVPASWAGRSQPERCGTPKGLKTKDLMMVPARVALALQDDGWWLRSKIIWHKPNPMPESVTDRPTSSYEEVFLLTKRKTYYYDADAIAEPVKESSVARLSQSGLADQYGSDRAHAGGKTNGTMKAVGGTSTRNARNVWTLGPAAYAAAHFATFPPELPRRCILAGSREGDTVLDPFVGAGTTLLVADRLGRHGIGVELNPEYVALAEARIRNDAPLFAEVTRA